MNRLLWLLLALGAVLLGLSENQLLLAQSGQPPVILASTTGQGIEFFEETETGLQSVGSLPGDFAVQSFGGTAEWLILSTTSFAISPDGQHIAFTARRDTEAALFLFTTSTGDLLQRPIVSYRLLPLWSPDSSALLLHVPFPFLDPVIPENFVYDVTLDQLIQITNDINYIEQDFVWASDSQSLIYAGRCELSTCEAERFVDLYLIDRDGTNRRALTNLSLEFPGEIVFPCNPVWSPQDARWYYEVGCLGLLDTHLEYVFSVGLSGDNRMEVDGQSYLQSTDGIGVELESIDIRSIHPRPDGIYVALQTRFFTEDVTDNLQPVQWRVIRIGMNGQIDTLYNQLTPGFDLGLRIELDQGALSPDAKKMAMLHNDGFGFVIDLDVNAEIGNISETPGVCDVRWINNSELLFNEGGGCL